MTIGGFYAKVVSLKDDSLVVMLGDTKVKIELGAVKAVIKSSNNTENLSDETSETEENAE